MTPTSEEVGDGSGALASRIKKASSDAGDTKQLREQAKQLARTQRHEAREKIRATKRAAREAKAAERAARRDRIVEAPRAPKTSIAQRLRRDIAKPPKESKATRRGLLSLLAVLLGTLGLICSIILAVGALLVAQGVNEDGSFYEAVSGICDVLIGPLRDVFSFEGDDAAMKESLAAWGAGSIGYLLAGLVVQSLLRPAADN